MLVHTNYNLVECKVTYPEGHESRELQGGEFCEVISTLTHDLTKARNQLVRLMNQVSPRVTRLYGGYSVPQKPLRPNTTPCVGSNAHLRHYTPAAGNLGWSNACPSAPVPPQRPCRPTTVHGANQFGQPQQRALLRPQQKVPKCCDRPHQKVEHPCEREQQRCNGSDTSGTSNLSERWGQRDSTCVNITFGSLDPAPAARRPHRCRRDIISSRSSKPCLQDSSDPARLQGGGSCRRHNCVGTQFAAMLEDVTSQLRVRRLGAHLVKTT